MPRFFWLTLLLVFILPPFAAAQSSHSNLFFSNSESLKIDPSGLSEEKADDSDSQKVEPQKYPSYQPRKPFSGIQTGTQPGQIEAQRQHRTLNQRFNIAPSTTEGGPEAPAPHALRSPFETIPFSELPVYGASLFQGHFSGTYYDERNPNYIIRYGDRIAVRFWGAFNFEKELTVDLRGNIFIPTVGPIRIAGIPNRELAKVVKAAAVKVYTAQYLNSYIDLMTANPMSVFVSGQVGAPGRYAGGATDSVLYYLDLAGGIDAYRGSYRDIAIFRRGKRVATVDLYSFMRDGELGGESLREGDVIVVQQRGLKVAVNGRVRSQAWFEFKKDHVTGKDVMQYAVPSTGVTHVSVQGYRDNVPMKKYMALDDFVSFVMKDEDTVEFLADSPSDSIVVYVEGALSGRSQFFVKKGTCLKRLLSYIPVNKDYANLGAVYLKRVSVAEQQAAALSESLFRLQQNSLTSSSQTAAEAGIRIQEAELINEFINRAHASEQQGVVTVADNGVIEDVYLEDSDTIVIPQKTDVVLITGQVLVPTTVIYKKDMTVEEYLSFAGGLNADSDENHILLFKSNGHVISVTENTVVRAGDTLMALPVFRSKNLEFARAITQIFYQIAVGTRAILQTVF